MLRTQVRAFKNLLEPVRVRSFATEAVFQTDPYYLHNLTEGPPKETTVKRVDALQYYENMQIIRRMETVLSNFYQAKAIRGFCHLYSGQEAVCTGVHGALRPQDTTITAYRCHAWALFAKDVTVEKIIAELFGYQTGCVRGKGGSMHIYGDKFYGGNAIVGAHVPVGVGIALTHKYNNTDAVSVTIYGDGASNSGQVFEAMNMAMLWKLPSLFLCENNLYAMGTSVARSSANPNLYKKGDVVPGIRANGMDVISMREATRFAINHCTSGKGPILLEAQTYRYFGHSMSDPGTSYRTREEIQDVRKNLDPIVTFKRKLIDSGLATENEIAEIEKVAKNIVDEATKKAESGKPLPIEELTYDIYSNDVVKEVRGVAPYKPMHHKTAGKGINLK